MTQQEQTLRHFRSVSRDWQLQSEKTSGNYEVIEWRNAAVLDVLERKANAARFLDVGCGTGQLVIEAARRKLEAEGVDFAPEMIARCRENAANAGVSAEFVTDSFFNLETEERAHDVISALGFIEYISPQQTDEFIRRCSLMLRQNGSLVLGSRNRLYNVFSLNDYTRMELECGVLNTLISEATALHSSQTLEAALLALRRFERIDPQPDRHPITGIPVETRYQYAPADLIFRLRCFGLTPKTLFPVHFHGLPPSVKDEQPDLHGQIALKAAEIGFRDHRLVPFSSSFVIEAVLEE
jgi:2-polyprenyl-3-methyl-5-hydroxy-6-metoxy-1,4-benzoquinol methylase